MNLSSASRAVAPIPSPVSSLDFERAHALCVDKTRRNIARLADRPVSGAFAPDGDYFSFPEGFFEIGNWTSSFFTGMALLAFEFGGDAYFLKQANRLADAYREKITTHRMDTMHDLGFLYSLYSVAFFRLTGSLDHRRTALQAADELAKRFSVKGGYIQSWGRMDDNATDYAGLAIIDCMMNLPLLFWATRETGNRFYHEIAIKHADTTRRHFVRTDDSVCHAFRFDPATGAPLRADNYCGHAVESHWARGTTWAVYGFALAYRHTGESSYLDTAERLARRYVALLDQELVPVWDFRLSNGMPPLRDSSAAAIAVCALDELLVHRPNPAFAAKADEMLHRLCTDDFLDPDPRCPGVLRQAEVGDGVGKAKSVYASWGDYFFMEALTRRLHADPHNW